jgi:hypothetical protein
MILLLVLNTKKEFNTTPTAVLPLKGGMVISTPLKGGAGKVNIFIIRIVRPRRA